MILWLYNHFFTVQRGVAIFHNEGQNPPHWIVFHKVTKMKHQIIVSEDEMICLHNKLQNPSHWIVLNEGLWFETDLEDKLGRRGPQCSAGPSPSAYSQSALPACGAESRTSGSEAEPEKQGQKLSSLATTPGWTFVFFQKLEVHEVHQKLEYWYGTVCMQSMQSLQQYNMPFSQLSSVKFHHMRSVWYRKALVVICMFYEYVLCMFFFK